MYRNGNRCEAAGLAVASKCFHVLTTRARRKQREEVECIRNACVTSLAAASCHLLSAGQTLLPELLVLRE